MSAFNSKFKLISFIFSTLILCLVSTHSLAGIIATVSDNNVAKGEVFLLKIVSDQRLSSNDINFNILKQDFFVGPPNFGQSVNSINGKSSIRSEWNLSLAPLRAGILTIPSFSVAKEKTEAIYITSTIDPDATNPSDLIEFQVDLSRNQIYPGEMTQLATRLIIKTDIRRLQDPKIQAPSTTGNIELEPIGTSKQYKTVIDGVEATIVDQAYQVIAKQSGAFTIYGPKLTGTIYEQNRKTGSTKLIPIDIEPANVELTILPKPEDIKGNWLPSPNLTLQQIWQDEDGKQINPAQTYKTKVGIPITRIIRLSVEGVTQSQIPDIEIDYPNSVRLYPEAAKFEQKDNTVVMTLKHVIIAKSQGNTILPKASINWWNTDRKSSKTAMIEELPLQVEKSDNQNVSLSASPSTPEKTVNNKTIEVKVKDSGIWPYLTAMFALLWIVFFILWFKNRYTEKTITTEYVDNESDTLNQFKSATQKEDGFKIQATINTWLMENPDLDAQTKVEIQNEIQFIMQAIYAKNHQNWSKNKILSLIKKAQKTKHKKNNHSDLAEL